MHYTVKDVAEMENVHPETVRRWIREGMLPVQKMRGKNNMNIISQEDYDLFLQNRKGIKIKYQIKKEIEDLVFEVQFAIRQEELANEEKKSVEVSFETIDFP